MAAIAKPRWEENIESSNVELKEGDYVLLCKRGVWVWGRIVNILEKGYFYAISMAKYYRYGDVVQCHRRHVFAMASEHH